MATKVFSTRLEELEVEHLEIVGLKCSPPVDATELARIVLRAVLAVNPVTEGDRVRHRQQGKRARNVDRIPGNLVMPPSLMAVRSNGPAATTVAEKRSTAGKTKKKVEKMGFPNFFSELPSAGALAEHRRAVNE